MLHFFLKTIALLLIFSFSNNNYLLAQNNGADNEIVWHKDKKLHYSDFCKKPGIKDTIYTNKTYDSVSEYYKTVRSDFLKIQNRIEDSLINLFLCNAINNLESIDWTLQRYLPFTYADIKYDTYAVCAANIAWQIKDINDDTKSYMVKAIFHKDMSFMIIRSKDNLDHEQIHFDIAEIEARKIRKCIVEHKNDLKDIEKLAIELDNIKREENIKFDYECKYCSKEVKREGVRLKWRSYIDNQLDSLKDYENIEETIKIK